MSQDKEKSARMKRLRAGRKDAVARAAARMKSQKKKLRGIRRHLKGRPDTIPRIAEATGLPADTVLWFVAAMKKYGDVVEDGQDGGYYRYALVAEEQEAGETAAASADA
jgi:hypothetical protein